MRTDGVFSLRGIRVAAKPGQMIRLIPFGDVHRDSPHFAHDKWQEFLHYAKGVAHESLFLGMGDYLDSYSTSERAVMYDSKLHESTRKREEEETKSRVDSLARELAFMKGRLIGLMGGNHFPLFSNGTTGDQRLADKLDTPYLGACTAVRLTFARGNKSATATVDIFAHHGKGGGITATGRMAAVEKLQTVCDADIFLMGDNHARGAVPLGDCLRICNGDNGLAIRSRQRWIGRTGSFLLAYVENQSSYVVDRALPPANLGWIEFQLTFLRQQEGNRDRQSVEIRCLQ